MKIIIEKAIFQSGKLKTNTKKIDSSFYFFMKLNKTKFGWKSVLFRIIINNIQTYENFISLQKSKKHFF